MVIKMKIEYNLQKADVILKDLSVLTGVSFSLLDADYNHITTTKLSPFCKSLQQNVKAKEKCRNCDIQLLEKCKTSGSLQTHICHAGLYDFAMPLKKHGITAGFLIFGQIKSTLSPSEHLGVLSGPYKEIAFYNEEKINCIKSLIPLLLFDDVIKLTYDSFFDRVAQYITLHIKEDLSVEFLCKQFHVSKNSLYKSFHENANSTVTDYITSARIDCAKKMLKETTLTVYKIAEEVGIENYTYFCRIFKHKTGKTPTQFRKT